MLSEEVSADELHEALRQLGAAMRAPTITGLRGGASHAAALVPQAYSHVAAPEAPATAPAATTTAPANAAAAATAISTAISPVAAAVPSGPTQALVPPPGAGRTTGGHATGGHATGGHATGGRAPPPDELLPAERWLIENRPRLAAIADQALGGDVGGVSGGEVGGVLGGVLGGDVGVPSLTLGYRAPSYPTTADGMARPSLGPSYHEPSYHEPSYHEPSYHEQPWHHPREGWALDPSSEPAAQLDALRDRISSLISAATTALHTTTTTTAAAAAAAAHAAGVPAQSQPSAPPAATGAPLPPAETYPHSVYYGPAATASPMGRVDLPRADGAHPPRASAGWALAPDAPPPELRPYGAESRRLAPALAGPSYDVSYDLPGMSYAPPGHWSHMSDSVTTSSDVARERLRHDVQVWTHACDHIEISL